MYFDEPQLVGANDPKNIDELRARLEYPLTDSDIETYLGKKVNIINFSELKNYKHIDELLPNDKSYVIILIEQEKNTGHWIAIMRYSNMVYGGKKSGMKTVIEYFNSYGLKPNFEMKFFNKLFGQNKNDLTKLLKNNDYDVIYNNVPFQSIDDKNINTCGSFVTESLEKYSIKMKYINESLDWDAIISLIEKYLAPKKDSNDIIQLESFMIHLISISNSNRFTEIPASLFSQFLAASIMTHNFKQANTLIPFLKLIFQKTGMGFAIEWAFLRYLILLNKNITINYYFIDNKEPISLTIPELNVFRFDNIKQVADLPTSGNYLAIPKQFNYPLIDGILKLRNNVYLLQVTLKEADHKGSTKFLIDTFNAFYGTLEDGKEYEEDQTFIYLSAVPERSLHEFKGQNFNKEQIQIEKDLKNINNQIDKENDTGKREELIKIQKFLNAKLRNIQLALKLRQGKFAIDQIEDLKHFDFGVFDNPDYSQEFQPFKQQKVEFSIFEEKLKSINGKRLLHYKIGKSNEESVWYVYQEIKNRKDINFDNYYRKRKSLKIK